MKNALFTLFIMLVISVSAQKETSNNNSLQNSEIATLTVRVYPLSFITGVKGELGYRFNDANLEVTIEGKYYYRDFFLRNRYKAQLPSLFYPSVNGGHLFLSLERRLRNKVFSLGGTIGLKSIQSSQFDISHSVRGPDEPNEYLTIDEKQYYGAFIARVRTPKKGLFVELVAKVGLVFTELNEEHKSVFDNRPESGYSDFISFGFPYVSVGINLGFGW